jgi:hypothetical protein
MNAQKNHEDLVELLVSFGRSLVHQESRRRFPNYLEMAMSDHADFAAAVTVREHVLNVALLAAYANGSFPKVLSANLPGGPPEIAANLFLGQPEINCEGATNLLVLTLATWGPLRVTLDGMEHVARIASEIEATIRPVFAPGSNLQLDPAPDDIVVRRWTASVTSEDTPPNVVSYVVGDQFKARLQQAIRVAIAFRLIKLPSIDVSFFGPLARLSTSVDARVRDGVLLLGLNVENESESIVGNVDVLVDFARSNDVAGVVNAAATALLLNDLHTRIVTSVENAGASLDRFSVTPAAGHFQVSGAARKSSGTVNFSFLVVPSMFHTRPGKFFTFLPKNRWVNSRIWPALEFHLEGVHTDVDRSWWVIVLEVFLGVLTVGFATLYIEDLVSAAAENFSGKVKAAKPGAPAARVRRTIPPPGGVGVRIGVDQFEITTEGTYFGISTRATSTPVALLGPTAVPSTYAGDVLRYLMRLPSGVSEADPALRIRWILEDRTNDVILVDEDGSAAGRLRFEFLPAGHANASEFGVIGRLYRRLGPNVTDVVELGSTSLHVHMREPLPPGAYIRWRSAVKNPQIAVDEATDTWTYLGEVRVQRWSEWHRTDLPCKAVNAPNGYRFSQQTADRLPFPLRLLESHRKGLCPYCFYGGPAGLNAAL